MIPAMTGPTPGAERMMPVRVGLGVQVRDPLVQVVHLCGQDLGLFGLDGDVGGQFGEVHAVAVPQLQASGGRRR